MKWHDMDKPQKKRLLVFSLTFLLIGTLFLSTACAVLTADKAEEERDWDSTFEVSEQSEQHFMEISQNAVAVETGTYLETIKEISIKSNYFRVTFLVWFRWEGHDELDMKEHFRVYKGLINKAVTVKDYHENGENYQLVRCDVTVTKNYETARFPLESHTLRVYVESTLSADKVVLTADKENSGVNPHIVASGYELDRHETGTVIMKYTSTHDDPELDGTSGAITCEHVTAFHLSRNGLGVYAKCFIALFGTITWALITLYICTYHRVDPLSMIPAALFGTVSNIMVGANLLPDALSFGLLEFVNIWGIATILGCALCIIRINRIRNKYQDVAYAKTFGRTMLFIMLALVLIGNLLMPLVAYMF